MMKSKILTALLSLVVAFGLWAYVITVVRPGSEQIYRDIHVSLDGERILKERGLMLIAGEDETVTLTISGNRSDLNKINHGNISVVADLSRIWTPGTKELKYTYSFPGDIAEDAVSVQRREPDHITVTVAQRKTKKVPVKINYTGTVADPNRYIIDKENVVLDYESIDIVGPDTVVDSIEQAMIEVDLTGRTDSFSEKYKITLCDKDGNGVNSELVTVNTAEVNLQLRIQRVKEVPLTVEIINGGGATSTTAVISVEPLTIKVAGSEQMLFGLSEIQLGTIDLGQIPEDCERPFPIKLDEGLINLTGVKEALVTISFPSLATREVIANRFDAINVPEEMFGEIVTKMLPVTIRGPKDVVGKVTPNDIIVVVDFTEAESGNSTLKATIKINSRYPEIGAVGTYSVPVTLGKEQPTPEPTEEE